jgi:hypothetical protein
MPIFPGCDSSGSRLRSRSELTAIALSLTFAVAARAGFRLAKANLPAFMAGVRRAFCERMMASGLTSRTDSRQVPALALAAK